MASPSLDRRTLLVLGGVLVAGCTEATRSEPTTPVRSRTPITTATSPTTSRPTSGSPTRPDGPRPSDVPRLPDVQRWSPSPTDITPRAKLAAVRAVERLGNHEGSALEVLEAQYGGILSSSASVLTVCRSWRLIGGRLVDGGRTYDVRLSRRLQRWQVTAIHPSRPGPPAPELSRPARRVLASDRIDLPPAARADVASGHVQDRTLTAMLRLSQAYRIGVSVIRSGHPTRVFGTDRLSDHPFGRAFDTWYVNDRAVIDPSTPEKLVSGYMRAVADVGAYNVGGPYLLGAAPQFFSDDTHHDHVHAGFVT